MEAVELGLHAVRAIPPCKPGYALFSWNGVNWAADGLPFNYLFELQFSPCRLLNKMLVHTFKGPQTSLERQFS